MPISESSSSSHSAPVVVALRRLRAQLGGEVFEAVPPVPPSPSVIERPRLRASELIGSCYQSLLRRARRHLHERGYGSTLSPSDLVHEAYLRASRENQEVYEGEKHFVFALDRSMRDILVQELRARKRLKRGGDQTQIELEDAPLEIEPTDPSALDLRQALILLRRRRPQQARIVRERAFEGRTVEEIAEATGLSTATVKRRWTSACRWIRFQLR
ncbi:MAG: sigma-70 family RNA polymerase sigma factor [Acidobacteriota bacterium]